MAPLRLRRVILPLLGALAAAACEPEPTTGNLLLDIKGLPAGAVANVRVNGPADFFQQVTEPKTLENLAPGDYVVRVDTITHSNTKYGVPFLRDTFTVVKGQTATASIPYAVASGSIDLAINGLPAGTPADIKITGAAGTNFSTNVPAAGIVGGLPPGKYYIQTDTMVSLLGDRFGASKVLDSVTVVASVTPVPYTVTYALVSATINLTISGLPQSVNFAPVQNPVTITGPSGYSLKTNATQSLRGLKPGTYSISGAAVNGTCPQVFRTSATPQTLTLAMGQIGSATVTYSEGTADPNDLNLRIDGLQLVQTTQDAISSVPMVANKPALVRVYGIASQCNTATPKVRVTLGTGQQFVINAPEQSTRWAIDEGTLQSTWNVEIPANLVQSGLTVFAEIDHDAQIVESNNSDNRFPSSGSREITVKTVPTIGVRLVPIIQGGLTGNVTPDLVDSYMDISRKLHPVAAYDVDIRSQPYTSSQTLAQNGGGWQALLNEINTLRFADSSRRYYYGLAKVSYANQGGVAGIGFVLCGNGDCKAALGWDRDLTSASEVMAHELGHNFGRLHAPCGGPAGPDTQYPNTGLYVGGKIGVWGLDYKTQTLKSPELHTDIMGYCSIKWISDYNYVGMLNYLSDPNRQPTLGSPASSASVEPSLLIWGRIENGQPVLEPVFEIDAPTSMPRTSGPNRLSALDESGNEVFGFAFAGARVADLPGDNETFTFVVPRSALRGRSVAQLRFTARGRTVTSTASAAVTADPQVVASRSSAGRVRLRWDATRFPVVMVRDRANGQVLSFARGGDMTIAADQAELEMVFSNRVRSASRVVRVLR